MYNLVTYLHHLIGYKDSNLFLLHPSLMLVLNPVLRGRRKMHGTSGGRLSSDETGMQEAPVHHILGSVTIDRLSDSSKRVSSDF